MKRLARTEHGWPQTLATLAFQAIRRIGNDDYRMGVFEGMLNMPLIAETLAPQGLHPYYQ